MSNPCKTREEIFLRDQLDAEEVVKLFNELSRDGWTVNDPEEVEVEQDPALAQGPLYCLFARRLVCACRGKGRT